MPAGRQLGFDPLYIISNGHSKKGTVAKIQLVHKRVCKLKNRTQI